MIYDDLWNREILRLKVSEQEYLESIWCHWSYFSDKLSEKYKGR